MERETTPNWHGMVSQEPTGMVNSPEKVFGYLMLFGSLWLVYAGIASLLSAPIVFLGRNRVHWLGSDLLAVILPFGVWMGLFLTYNGLGKSLANLGEPVYFSLAVPVAALVRVAAGARREWVCSASLIVSLCLFAAGVYFWMPALPE